MGLRMPRSENLMIVFKKDGVTPKSDAAVIMYHGKKKTGLR